MARARDPKRAQAEKIWLDSNGGMDIVEIAELLGLPAGTVRGWKSKDGWADKLAGEDPNPTEGKKKQHKAPKKTTERSKANTERSEKRTERSDRKRNAPIREQPPPWVIEEQDWGEPGADGLTDKMRFFAREYVRTMNATKAALAAGYSKKTAYSIGSENLRKPQIKAEIKRLQDELLDEIGLDARRIVAEYQKIAFADIGDFVEFGQKEVPVYTDFGPLLDDDGEQVTRMSNYVSFKNADEVDSSLIQEIKMGRDGPSVKLYSRVDALKELGKRLGLEAEVLRLKIEKEKLELSKLKDEEDGNTIKVMLPEGFGDDDGN